VGWPLASLALLLALRLQAAAPFQAALRRALQLGQFELYYQPKLRLADRQMLGVEALIRWHHPALGLVSPGEFIPLAEETGLIVPLGRWIVRQACADLAAWHAQGLAGLSCAINVSPVQFETDGLLELLRETVADFGLAPEKLEIELTESALIHDTARSIGLLNEFRRQGFAVWVDDFGTGYSSLSYLRQFPVTGLKIDQSFIRDMTVNANDAAIVAAVIALTRERSSRMSVAALPSRVSVTVRWMNETPQASSRASSTDWRTASMSASGAAVLPHVCVCRLRQCLLPEWHHREARRPGSGTRKLRCGHLQLCAQPFHRQGRSAARCAALA
jgi:EAL domain-containing protein (putative c-di-GMP-specific phosphodiesterase class I)